MCFGMTSLSKGRLEQPLVCMPSDTGEIDVFEIFTGNFLGSLKGHFARTNSCVVDAHTDIPVRVIDHLH